MRTLVALEDAAPRLFTRPSRHYHPFPPVPQNEPVVHDLRRPSRDKTICTQLMAPLDKRCPVLVKGKHV
ncbi:hypothetical protein E2C01_083757 [Portunus trituberculatus]|uniref:Uncharacterized protein n=1 Tax=Portunus trituberculatus TaxID=210409 RepID=A0A5B7J4H2_PORTR|nr:hypothetical protein [Portunus trituberculatus]